MFVIITASTHFHGFPLDLSPVVLLLVAFKAKFWYSEDVKKNPL